MARRTAHAAPGRREFLAALLYAGAKGSRTVGYRRLRSILGQRVTDDAIDTLASDNSDAVTASTGTFKLTDAGLIEVRSHPEPRSYALG